MLRLTPGRLPRVYPGWTMVGAVSLTETVSYGILAYAFAVLVAPVEAETGWSRTAVTGAYSVALGVSGLLAIPAGRWVDRHGARALMTAGSAAAALLLLAWASVDTLAGHYLVWAGLGAAMAAVLYEPAFAVVATWFRRGRGRALTALTFAGGFASVIFVPLAERLVRTMGWRGAAVALAAILAVLTIPPHALLLRRRPADLGLAPDGDALPPPGARSVGVDTSAEAGVTAREALRSRAFVRIAAGFALATLATSALPVHLVMLLGERGHAPAAAAAVMGAVGAAALPGRLVLTPLGDRVPRGAVAAAIFGLQAAGILVLLASSGGVGLWGFVLLFGAGFGAISPARAALVAESFGAAEYGAIGGALALVLAASRALAPVGASVLHSVAGYPAVLAALAAASLLAGVAVLPLGGGRRSTPLAEAAR